MGHYKTIDPEIMFGGVSYNHSFIKTINGNSYQPGDGLEFHGGFGFAMNDRISASARVSVAHNQNSKYNGLQIQGSSSDPMTLGFSLSYRTLDGYTISPMLSYGLNDEASGPEISIGFTSPF